VVDRPAAGDAAFEQGRDARPVALADAGPREAPETAEPGALDAVPGEQGSGAGRPVQLGKGGGQVGEGDEHEVPWEEEGEKDLEEFLGGEHGGKAGEGSERKVGEGLILELCGRCGRAMGVDILGMERLTRCRLTDCCVHRISTRCTNDAKRRRCTPPAGKEARRARVAVISNPASLSR